MRMNRREGKCVIAAHGIESLRLEDVQRAVVCFGRRNGA